MIALPLTAVLVLGVSPSQMGFLAAAEKLPFLLVGLLAGVLVDRLRYRSLLVAADLGRAVLFGSIPVAAAFGVLRMEQLYVVALLAGCLTVFSTSPGSPICQRWSSGTNLPTATASSKPPVRCPRWLVQSSVVAC